ncbi:MAG: hypothetical protein OSJ83_12350, partial [Clostridia bacterium]|nr:hypothetical protein [Clostridia bacterium]
FSPYKICAVKSDTVNAGKSVYATVDGVGGKVENAEIRKVEQGKSVTFNIVKDAGYDYDSVLLNGKDVKSKIVDGVLTLGYDELTGYKIGNNLNPDTNVLEVSFISERVKAYNEQNGITLVRHKIVVSKDDLFEAVAHVDTAAPAPNKSNVGLIVGIVVPLVILLIGGGIAAFLILRKKKNAPASAKASANGASKNSTSASARPASTNARPTNTNTRSSSASTRPSSSRPTNASTHGKNDKNKK